jgi:hypothetical protein
VTRSPGAKPLPVTDTVPPGRTPLAGLSEIAVWAAAALTVTVNVRTTLPCASMPVTCTVYVPG